MPRGNVERFVEAVLKVVESNGQTHLTRSVDTSHIDANPDLTRQSRANQMCKCVCVYVCVCVCVLPSKCAQIMSGENDLMLPLLLILAAHSILY